MSIPCSPLYSEPVRPFSCFVDYLATDPLACRVCQFFNRERNLGRDYRDKQDHLGILLACVTFKSRYVRGYVLLIYFC